MKLPTDWREVNTFEPNNPYQMRTAYYSPADGMYTSQYWNAQPRTTRMLDGVGTVDVTNSGDVLYSLVVLLAGFAGGYWFRNKHALIDRKVSGLKGARRRRARKSHRRGR